MKKFLLFIMFAFSSVVLTATIVNAAGTGKAKVVVHYKNWSEDYTNLGAHAWGSIAGAMEKPTGEDDFGIYFEFNDFDVKQELGFIAVKFKDGQQDWNAKETGDVKVPANTLVEDQVNHVYVFEGAVSSDVNPGYYLAKNDHYNMVLVYADPAGIYEENLGVHAWNNWTIGNSNWAEPTKVFTNGSSHTAISTIKVAMLHTTNIEAGLLIYAGEDGNKKTGDVTLKAALASALPEGTEAKLGDTGFAYVYSKGNGYTANDNVLYNGTEFAENTFAFKLLPMGVASNGQFNGTYAPQPNQVIVEASANLASPLHGDDKVSEEAGDAIVKGWFTVKDTDGNELAIQEVHYAKANETIKDFVIILANQFDITKDYVVVLDLGLEGNDNRTAEIEINLDREKPVITFISPIEILGKPEAERIIIVEWNKKFNQNLFPSFTVTDDRDGDLTSMVYVPKGDFSKINTNVEGDYVIMLQVEDSWGNITQEKFTFRVTKNK